MVHALLCRDRLIVPFARVDETTKFWTAMIDVSWRDVDDYFDGHCGNLSSTLALPHVG